MTAKKNYFLGILREGEVVVSITDRIITVRDEKGDTFAYWYKYDAKGVPVIEDRSLMITTGNDMKGMSYDDVGSENILS